MSDKFEMYCIVEIMGHQRIAGMVSEQEIAGSSFLRVDVPQSDGIPAFSKFYGASAIYAITPVDEETCKLAVRSLRQKPIVAWQFTAPQLEERVTDPDIYDDEDDYNDDGWPDDSPF